MYKKNCLLVFLLFLVALPELFSIYTIADKVWIEYRMEQELMNGNLQVISLNKSEITWLKENEEALIGGEFFDVKSFTLKGDTITVTGLFDKNEECLKEKIEKYTNSGNKSASLNNKLIILLFATYYNTAEPISLNGHFFIYKKQTLRIKNDINCDSYSEIIIPPPRKNGSHFNFI